MRGVHSRLQALERRPHPSTEDPEWTDEDRFALYEDLGRKGCFRKEPDFPAALAHYRTVLATVGPTVGPRDRFRHPAVFQAREWLAGFCLRAREDIPPVTEAEFRDLTDWFNANEARLARLAHPSCLLDLGDGRQTSVANSRYGVNKGPRAIDAGVVAEDLRRLRACYEGLA